MPNRELPSEHKPIVTAQPASLFGEVPDEVLMDPNVGSFDLPGYSDKRAAIELARARGKTVIANGVTASPTDTMKYRFQYVRAKGQPRVAEWRQKGYESVEFDQLAEYGIDVGRAPGVEKGPDGKVYNGGGELLLMVADAQVAGKELAKQRALTKAQLESNPFLESARVRAAKLGGSVTLTENEPR